MRFGVLADDLTGAMDAGAGFAGLGLDTVVVFGKKPVPEARVVVISTDSRVALPETAYRMVKQATAGLAGRYVYKKIDSTLRGNIGRELRAVMTALNAERAVICPAFPANGRSVVGGNLLVDDVPVDKTSFAQDPVSPVTEANIPALLSGQGGFSVGTIGLDIVNQGPPAINRQLSGEGHRIVVIDAVTQGHLRYIAEALASAGTSWLPCGSAGLAMELPSAFGCQREAVEMAVSQLERKPVLVVASSRHQVTLRQIKMAEAQLASARVTVEPAEFVSGEDRLTRQQQLAGEANRSLAAGRDVIITSAYGRYAPEMKDKIAAILAGIAAVTVRQGNVTGLVLTGGDVAREACAALNVSGLKIRGELEPGVVVGEVMGDIKGGLKMVTKAGGFGSDGAILDAICYLGRGRRWNKE
ncbi:four-carbon acid sugar kinase family protein [Chloroflexota bacterium]